MSGRVWIVGAGFSQPLGAPLFSEILDEFNEPIVDAVLQMHNEIDGDRCLRKGFQKAATALYKLGKDEQRWSDPEQFLQLANDAFVMRRNSPLAKWIVDKFDDVYPEDGEYRSVLNTSMSAAARFNEILAKSREVLAIETSAFLIGANLESEMWNTYQSWFRTLESDDTIITFNYDEVLENLARSFQDDATSPQPPQLRVQIPGQEEEIYRSNCSSNHSVILYKLHGSVGWKMDIDRPGEIQICSKPLDFLSGQTHFPVIFTPGPAKREANNKSEYVENAMRFLANASLVHIIGYRFPQTDMFAMKSIVTALSQKQGQVKVVLGPDPTKDLVRVKRILQVATRSVKFQAMYSQDYLNEVGGESSRKRLPSLASDQFLHPKPADFFG